MAKKMTQLEKLLKYMGTGKQVTTADAVRRGVQNLSARIYEPRDMGYRVYTNSRKIKGEKTTCYRLDEKRLPKVARVSIPE